MKSEIWNKCFREISYFSPLPLCIFDNILSTPKLYSKMALARASQLSYCVEWIAFVLYLQSHGSVKYVETVIASTYIFQFSPNTLCFISTKFNIIHPLRTSHTYFPDAHKRHPPIVTPPPFIYNAPQYTNDILALHITYYPHTVII